MRGARPLRAALLAALAAVLLLGSCAATTGTPDTAAGQSEGSSGLPVVALADLPPQARETHRLVLADGPYPYPQDDRVFGNREGVLPAADYGWYREYTVETPGSPDRGARRLVVGGDEMFFYTDDHYTTFREVRR